MHARMSDVAAVDPSCKALADLLRQLLARDYRFTTPTPLTHQRVLAQRQQVSRQTAGPHPARASDRSPASDLRDIFGWNLPFQRRLVDPGLLDAMVCAGAVAPEEPAAPDEMVQSAFRVSSLGNDLFVHSAFPTVQSCAVFFGPDTYRFARFIGHALQAQAPTLGATHGSVLRVLDIGCGTGAGGVAAVRVLGQHTVLTLNDINPLALRYASANVAAAGVACQWLPGDAMAAVVADYDVIIANPPYLDDDQQRAYRHGGARLGRDLSLRMVVTALAHLAPGGTVLLYTGVAMVGGHDPFLAELRCVLRDFDGSWAYSEIDPDVFGEELERPVYAHIDRIAAVGLVATRRLAA